jgi:hypothetical protein
MPYCKERKIMKTKEKIITEIKDLVSYGRVALYYEAIIKKQLTKEQIKTLEETEGYQRYKKDYKSLNTSYQRWYTKSLAVIRQIMPERYNEFVSLYSIEKRKEIDYLTYSISDYLIGLSVTRGIYKEEVINPFSAFHTKFENQISILESTIYRIESILNDIEGILQSDLFENELDAAKDLLKKKHIRSSGALVGVVLESHLRKVCANHDVKFRKNHPTISDYNEELRKEEIIDVPTWRLIQRLGDIRNLSVHSKDREPTTDEIEDLIRGAEKLIAELF